jgi:hypothetical protein
MEFQMRRPWSRDELLIAFNLYCRMPFGRLHQRNPTIISVADHLGRTPGSVAMKLCNFAAFDPLLRARGVRGLSGVSVADRELWDEFHADWTRLAIESQQAMERLCGREPIVAGEVPDIPQGPSEAVRPVRVRLVQSFFRQAVLASYEGRCAICSLGLRRLLTAGHIIPWSVSRERRADPTNGLALCALHDRAFDAGLIGVDESMRVMVADKARCSRPPALHRVGLLDIEGSRLAKPRRFAPDPKAIAWHRENIFGHDDGPC